MSLDLSKLVGAKRLHGKITAQCPICLESSQSHLVVFPDGKFGCVVNSSPEHRSAIWRAIGTDSDDAPAALPEPKIEIPKTWPVSVLDRLVKDHSYWVGRGVSESTVAAFRGGVATEAQMAGRYVFPQFNPQGEVIGFSGRCVKQMTKAERKQFNRPKWKHLAPSSDFLWGDLTYRPRAILVESIGDGLKLIEHKARGPRCLFGTTLSETLLGHLIALSPECIIVSTNLDEATRMGTRIGHPGQEAAARIKKTLDKFFNPNTVTIMHPPCNDWGDATPEQIHQAFP